MRFVAAAVALLIAASAGGTAVAAQSRGCGSAGRTVIEGSAARVYEQSSHVYACWLGHNRRVQLDMAHSRWRLANVKGRFAAVAFDRAGSPAALVWVKLGSRPQRRIAYTFPEGGPQPPAAQLYVSPRGAVAFSTPSAIGFLSAPPAGGAPSYRELDSGAGVEPDSLWAYDKGHRLYWLHDDVRMSASWR
jgi:hypothetical protein